MEAADRPRVRKKQTSDFRFGPVLGEGSFSTVSLATEVATGNEYAMKVLEKAHIIKEHKVHQVDREKRILTRLGEHPFFVKLFFTFQDTRCLYFGLSVARRGELHSKIRQLGKFDMECTRFYSAQIVTALEYMHSLNIIHRDLKPENILFNDEMNIQITDFGTAKDLNALTSSSSNNSPNATGDSNGAETEESVDVWELRTSTFVGTAQFISPEVLTDKKACASSDLWAFGCIVYQMITGKFAFNSATEYLTLTKVQSCKYEIPDDTDPVVVDLIKQILVLDPTKRLGSREQGGYETLKQHPFFEGINWKICDIIPVPDAIKEVLVSDSSDDDEPAVNNLLVGFDQIVIPDAAEAIPIERISYSNGNSSSSEKLPLSEPADITGYGLPAGLSPPDRSIWMQKQRNNVWNYYTEGKLILKQGQLEKKRRYSTKVREFLLLEGPRLLYIDPSSKQVKGEIPWSGDMRLELKTFRLLDVITPHRTYHLIDKTNNAMMWCKRIQQVIRHYFPNSPGGSPAAGSSSSTSKSRSNSQAAAAD